MSLMVFEGVLGKDLSGLIASLNTDPEKSFTVTIEEIEDEDMPPEEMISQKLIDAVKRSEEDIKAGRYTECKTNEDIDSFFKKILDEQE
ncbi:MAG: hypothetical protein HQK91_06675 [Nitrospirae bacterium]|nr:hypothetical protein [Nitrospirota bacterium]MBF0541117.1 hypothetical protein [Nitrospirota bacterium]